MIGFRNQLPFIVQIDIADQNDNSPVLHFSNVENMEWVDDSEVIIDIDEECQVATVLLNIIATDKDQGRNGKVFFRLENLQDLISMPFENKGM